MWNDEKQILLTVQVNEEGLLSKLAKIQATTEELNREVRGLQQMLTTEENASLEP